MLSILNLYAIITPVCSNGAGKACGLPTTNADPTSLHTIMQIVFAIIGALALLMVVISGLRYITSDGSPDGTTKARNGIIYSLVGLGIAITAEAIVSYLVKNI